MAIVSSYEIHRGRRSELDKVDTGTAIIRLIDLTGELDPASGNTDYDPMKPVAIGLFNPVTDAWSTIFRGFIGRWSYEMYPSEHYGIATLECVDALDIFAATEMTPSPLSTQGAFGDVIFRSQQGNIVFYEDDQVADRLNQVLDQIGWPSGDREIFSGNVSLRETVYAPRSTARSAIDDATDAEFPAVAQFWISKDGKATFHGRRARFFPDVADYHISKWRCGDAAAVASDSTRALISGLDYDRDKDKIINSGLATPENIPLHLVYDQRVMDSGSIDQYGIRSWSAQNLITKEGYLGATTALEETKKFATYYVSNYADPRTAVRRVQFSSRTAGGTNARIWAILAGVDLSDIIRLKTTHMVGGFDEDFYVEGIHYQVKPLNDEYMDVTLDLDVSPRAYYNTDPFDS